MAEEFTAEEKAYMESHGETPLPEVSEESVVETTEVEATDTPEVTEEVAGEETVTEEAQEGDKEPVEAAEGKKDSDWVPMARFKEKNRQVDEMGVKLDAANERSAKIEGRLEQMLKAGEPPPPDPEEDPDAFNAHQLEEKDRQIAQLTEKNEEADRNQREVAEVNEINAVWTKQVAEAEDVNYQAKQDFLLNSRREELRGLGMVEEKIEAQLGLEVWNTARDAYNTGKNMVKVVDKMARNVGYKDPNGKDATEASSKLDTIEKAQEAQSPLKDGGGGGSASPLTIEKIANMSDLEFSAYCAKNPDYLKRIRAMSG